MCFYFLCKYKYYFETTQGLYRNVTIKIYIQKIEMGTLESKKRNYWTLFYFAI